MIRTRWAGLLGWQRRLASHADVIHQVVQGFAQVAELRIQISWFHVPMAVPSPMGEVRFNVMEQGIEIASNLAHSVSVAGVLQPMNVLGHSEHLVRFAVRLSIARVVLEVVIQFQAKAISFALELLRQVVDV